MKIRKFKKSDTREVKKLISNILKDIFKVKKVHDLDDFDNVKKAFDILWIAEENNKIIGTIGIRNKKDARLSRMYIKKSYRGKGLGRKLMQKAIKYCKGKYKRIFLTTYVQMKSRGFYEKMGFKVIKINKKNKEIEMEKFL